MQKQGLNKSVLALILASSATGGASTIPASVVDVNHAKNSNPAAPKIYRYGLSVPARYKHETQGYVDGRIFLNITKSNVTPAANNKITAEFQGELYFLSNKNVGSNQWFESLGGEDGKIILDLVNKPSKNEPNRPLTYNVHGCNSTLTACAPMSLQVHVYKNGTVTITGRIDESVQILDHGQWVSSFSDKALISLSTSR